jgi:hypothetical protein
VTDREEALRKRLNTILIIWLVFLLSLAVYAAVFYIAGEQIKASGGKSEAPVKLLRLVFAGVSVFQIVVSFFLRKKLPGGMLAQSKLLDHAKLRSDEEYNLRIASSQYLIAVLISLAISESIALYGIVLFILGADYNTLLTFVGISALAMVLHCPRQSELETVAEKLKQG